MHKSWNNLSVDSSLPQVIQLSQPQEPLSSQVCWVLALRVASPPRIVYRNITSHPSCAANIGQVWLMDRAEFNF